MCLCVTSLLDSSVLKEVTYQRPVDKICSSGKSSEMFLEVNIYNIDKSTDYTDVCFSCLYSDPPGKYLYSTSNKAMLTCLSLLSGPLNAVIPTYHLMLHN